MTQKRAISPRRESTSSVSLPGEPDFPTPPHVIDAAYAAACADTTRYPPTDGTPALRAAIQRKFLRDNELRYDISQILTAGGADRLSSTP